MIQALWTIYIYGIYFSADEGVARGKDALTLLDNTDTRNSFINELLEVRTSGDSIVDVD